MAAGTAAFFIGAISLRRQNVREKFTDIHFLS
jgi:hypothetical protein